MWLKAMVEVILSSCIHAHKHTYKRHFTMQSRFLWNECDFNRFIQISACASQSDKLNWNIAIVGATITTVYGLFESLLMKCIGTQQIIKKRKHNNGKEFACNILKQVNSSWQLFLRLFAEWRLNSIFLWAQDQFMWWNIIDPMPEQKHELLSFHHNHH